SPAGTLRACSTRPAGRPRAGARTCSTPGSAAPPAPPGSARSSAGRAGFAAGSGRWWRAGCVRAVRDRESVGWSRRFGWSCGHLLALLTDQPQERLVQVVGAGGLFDALRGVVGDDPPLSDQQQPVTAVGLVHLVTGHHQGGDLLCQPPE